MDEQRKTGGVQAFWVGEEKEPVRLKTYSVVINWCDGDHEQGTFGATVRAADHEEAERKARKEMRDAYLAEHGSTEDDDEAKELASGYEHEDPFTGETVFGGSLIECSEGAHWKSVEMEAALRDLVAAWDTPGGRIVDAQAVVERARAIIAEIDKL